MSTPSPTPPFNEFFKKRSELLCAICDKPVAVDTAKMDGNDKAFHEECYRLKLKLEQASRNGHDGDVFAVGKVCSIEARPWKVIAAEVASEQDPKKLSALVVELNHALDEQGLDGKPKIRRDTKRKPDAA